MWGIFRQLSWYTFLVWVAHEDVILCFQSFYWYIVNRCTRKRLGWTRNTPIQLATTLSCLSTWTMRPHRRLLMLNKCSWRFYAAHVAQASQTFIRLRSDHLLWWTVSMHGCLLPTCFTHQCPATFCSDEFHLTNWWDQANCNLCHRPTLQRLLRLRNVTLDCSDNYYEVRASPKECAEAESRTSHDFDTDTDSDEDARRARDSDENVLGTKLGSLCNIPGQCAKVFRCLTNRFWNVLRLFHTIRKTRMILKSNESMRWGTSLTNRPLLLRHCWRWGCGRRRWKLCEHGASSTARTGS